MKPMTCDTALIEVNPALKLADRNNKPEGTVVEVNGTKIGGREFIVMAGPCAVENEYQLLTTAQHVAANGAKILRGGAFKPRTSPYSFEGLGLKGLQLLSDARTRTGLPIVTEVMDTKQMEVVSEYADILQVGSRNMQNFPLLKEVGMSKMPVLLKRGMMSTIEEFLLAAEHIMSHGNDQIILCERGIRTFETATRNTLDLSAVPLLKRLTHLPVCVDPSHGTGIRWMVPEMAKGALAVGADAIQVEVHYDPDLALCDGDQSLFPKDFDYMMTQLRKIAPAVNRTMTDEVVELV
jgi:3-deoxy-7-phosphoheptulonate synthase